MNKLYRYIRGYATASLCGVALDVVLNGLAREKIAFWDVAWLDSFNVKVSVFCADVNRVSEIAEANMCATDAIAICGFKKYSGSVLRRPVLIFGMLLALIVVLYAQNFLLFYSVSGNVEIPSEHILQKLEEIGIGFGTYGPDVKPKWIKDHLLNELPQLQWITVTQNGSLAQVVVRERPETPTISNKKGYANIIAGYDGIITSQSVLSGQAVKKVGDPVVEGEMLVSGVIDHEIKYSVVYAKAEIFARTWRNEKVVTPEKCLVKHYIDEEAVCVWIELGKKRIKIFGNSGISYTGCDKMIDKINITLPGGYQLPLSVCVEHFVSYEEKGMTVDLQQAQLVLGTSAVNNIMQQMRAGEILSESSVMTCADGRYQLDVQFECHEMIARTAEGKWNVEDFAK